VPQTPEQRRFIRGLEVLSRMGLESADEFLATLAGEEYPALIRQHATLILDPDSSAVLGGFGNPVMQLQQNLFAPE
jgi:hypothetical protein